MISSTFIRRPKLAFIISIIITITGIISYLELPVSQFPDITPPTVSVSAVYPGADAVAVEQAIAQIIEPAVNGVEHMAYMQSSSGADGTYNLVITFNSEADADLSAINVSNRVNRVLGRLPAEVQRLSVPVTKGAGSLLFVAALYSPKATKDELFLSNYARLNILDEMSRIPGVASAYLYGGRDYAMRLWLDINRMSELELTTYDVINAVNSQHIQAAAGRVGAAPLSKSVDFQLNITSEGKLLTPEEFENIILRADKSGGIIRIKDIGRVELSTLSHDSVAHFNGKPAVGIAVNLLPRANAIQTSDGIRKLLSEIEPQLPTDVKYQIMYDTSFFVKKMMSAINYTLLEAFILSALVVYAFLGSSRSAIIPLVAVPVSIVGTFTIIYAMGYTLNTISLLALVLAIGIVVDDAIVVVENVTHVMETDPNLSAREATEIAMKQISAPIIAITLVLLAVFIPTIFIPGITGKLYQQFSVAIGSSMVISAINAMTLSPALCSLLLRQGNKPYAIFSTFRGGVDKTRSIYSRLLIPITRRPIICLFTAISIGGVAYKLENYIPSSFVSAEDQGAFMGEILLPDAASLTRTTAIINQVENDILKKEWAQNIFSVSGFSLLRGLNLPNAAFFAVLLKPYEARTAPSLSIQSAISDVSHSYSNLLTAEVFPYNFPALPGLGKMGGLEFEIQSMTGANIDEFAGVAAGFINSANKIPSIHRIFTGFTATTPQVKLKIDRERAQLLGLSLNEIYNTLQINLAGSYINDFNYLGRTWQVKVQADSESRMNIEDIFKIRIRSNNNEMVPLKSIADVEIVTAPDSITRLNNLRSIGVSGYPNMGYSSGDAINALDQLAKKTLPPNYKIQWTGIAVEEKIAASQRFKVFVLSVLFSYLFLVALYESWLLPMAVLLSVSIGLFGAYCSLLLAGLPNNIYAQIGIIVLIALASKNAILVIELASDKHKHGLPILESAIQGATQRLRAILMTSFAFILGIYPLVIASGPGAATQRSVSTALFGGMLTATVIGIFFISGLYCFFQNAGDYFSQLISNTKHLD